MSEPPLPPSPGARPSVAELAPSAFTYELPEGRIAQHPLAQRDAARLLCYRAGELAERRFAELPQLLPMGSLLVFNTTRVVPARLLFAKPTGAAIELFCLKPAHEQAIEQALQARGQAEWLCLVGNLKRWTQGPLTLRAPLGSGELQLMAERLGPTAEGERIRLSWSPEGLTLAEAFEAAGQVPLPPYLKRPEAPTDAERYQTVYAQQQGAVAAPTAGLHFTPELMAALERRGVARQTLVLHVGAGTFRPVTAERLADHAMHSEEVIVGLRAIRHLAQHLAPPGGPGVVAVGTTSMRTLESLYWFGLGLLQGRRPATATHELHVGQWEPYEALATELPPAGQVMAHLAAWMEQRGLSELRGHTQLLIVPGYPFRLCQGLITNFHQPGSTLLLLVAAFVGDDWRRVYDYALANDFRFLSYGDSSLLWNPQWPTGPDHV